MFPFLTNPISRGIQLMRRRDFAAARSHFEELVRRKVRLPEAYFNLAKCFYRLGDLAAAKENFHRSLDEKFDPELARGVLEVTNWKMLASPRFFNASPAFSPDGSEIAFTSARADTNGDGRINASDRCGIYIVNTLSGEERCVVPDSFKNAQPVFSPDGRYLAYFSARADGGENTVADQGLFLTDLRSGGGRRLLDGDCRAKHYVFSPDGKRLIFSGWRPGEKNSGIYAIDLATGAIATIVSGAFENTFPSISSDGKRLTYSSWRRDTNGDGAIDFHDNSGLYVRDAAGGTETTVASDRYNNTFPAFSPDGRKILFLSVRRDTNHDGKLDALDNAGIYLYDLGKKRERCLIDDTFFNKFASFTPDGQRIVFISNWRRLERSREVKDFVENKGVYVMDLESGEIEQLVSDKYYGSRSPVVSPKGNAVAYVSWREGTNRGLYLAYLHGLPAKEQLHRWIDHNI